MPRPLLLLCLFTFVLSLGGCKKDSGLVVRIPAVGISFHADQESDESSFTSYTATGVRDKECALAPMHRDTFWQGKRLSLVVNVPAKYQTAYQEWLNQEAPLRKHLYSNGELLKSIFSRIDASFDLLLPNLPATRIRYDLSFIPQGCRFIERHTFTGAEAKNEFVVPIALDMPFENESDVSGLGIGTSFLARVVAHEAMHVFQLYPFDAATVMRLHAAHLASSPDVHLWLDLEVEAVIADYCLKQVILPDSWGYVARRKEWMRLQGSSIGNGLDAFERAGFTPEWHNAFLELHADLGDEFVAPTGVAGLTRLLTFCARRLDPASTDEQRIERVESLLREIDRLGGPIYFSTLLYPADQRASLRQ